MTLTSFLKGEGVILSLSDKDRRRTSTSKTSGSCRFISPGREQFSTFASAPRHTPPAHPVAAPLPAIDARSPDSPPATHPPETLPSDPEHRRADGLRVHAETPQPSKAC